MIVATCPLCKFEFETDSTGVRIDGTITCMRGYGEGQFSNYNYGACGLTWALKDYPNSTKWQGS